MGDMSSGATVLVIDDDPDVQEIFSTILRTEGYRVEQARNGEEGLDALDQLQPDLVILDLMMPKADGWQVMRQLSSNGGCGAPVIAVTASGVATDRLREAGFCAFLRKPVTPSQVLRAVDICLAAHTQGEHWIPDLPSRINACS